MASTPTLDAPRPRRRLFWKYVVVIVALVTMVLAASAGVELWFTYRENQGALVALQREKAGAAATQIEAFIRDIEHQMGWTTQPLLVSGPAALEQRRIDFLRLLRQVAAITELIHIDAEGKEQLRISRLQMDVAGSANDLSGDPRFTQAVARRKACERAATSCASVAYHGPVTFRKESEPYMVLAMGQSGGGVTVAEVNLKFIWDVVTQIKIGKAGRAYVADERGDLIAHPDISLVLQKTSLATLPQVREAIAGAATGSPVARDVHGRRVLTAYATIPGLRWVVFAEQPLGEALEPLQASIKRSLALLMLGIALAVVASVMLARRMVRPIQALQVGAARIGGGELGHRLEIQSGDELETLAGEFNRMTAHLQESYATLEQRVEDRTRALSESLEQQTATAEILSVISGSPTDIQPVLEIVAKNAMRVCGASDAIIRQVDGDLMTHAVHYGAVPLPAVPADTRRITRDSVSGRAILERRTIHLSNLLDPEFAREYPEGAILQQRAGYGTIVATPLLREGTAIGVIMIRRMDPNPFTDKQLALLQTFADQAVIAIENVRLFTELQERTSQLQVASRHKDEFLANMSHELRTPLNAIIGFSEVMIERMFGEINEKQEEYLNDILSSGRHLLSLINDILDLSKIEAGKMELDLTDFNLAAAIDNALTLVHERAARRSLTLAQEVDERIGDFRGDERKIKQVLLNLLSNAIKFTPEGGRVAVRAVPKGDVIEISVVDTGVGIAPEDRDVVFEEFRQVGTDIAKKHEGTGLGLALTRRFVELHGGNIWLESEVGVGSTFTFALPVRR